MEVETIRSLLGPDYETWLAHLDAIGPADFDIVLPPADDLPPVLLKLAVPHEDIDDLVAMHPDNTRWSAELRWLLERCTHALAREMGLLDGPPWFPNLPESVGPLQRYFYIYVFLATLPRARAYHLRRGIPDDVSWRTFADLGRNLAVHRRRYATGGLDVAFWLMLHFRGVIYDMGRLQFNRGTLGNRTGQAIAAAGLPYGPGDFALGVHIPDFSGPFTPRACDASFARAKEFFARYFPEEPYHIATCHSWLLDEQLAEYLPESSNIIQFQRRFRPAYQPDDDDKSIIRFVFGRMDPVIDELPQRTRLERAVVAHIRSGRHWHGGAGWLEL